MSYHHHPVQTIAFFSLGILNVIVYILVFTASILKTNDGKLGEIIQTIYCCLFSIFLVFNELRTFNAIEDYFGFLHIHHGKGLMMLFLGCVVMCENAFNIIVSIFGFTLGLGYVILSFIPSVPRPKDLCYLFHQVRQQQLNPPLGPEYSYHTHHALPLPKQAVHPSARAIMVPVNY
ncbi:hypothetical protein [Absidia glauca]|uniref:COPI associated protein n=1 Tax=Absidia glauca TaxID=4829 RepID=A0A168NVU4_ABSGL|nr:hypothetical protein [Absidia glauca]